MEQWQIPQIPRSDFCPKDLLKDNCHSPLGQKRADTCHHRSEEPIDILLGWSNISQQGHVALRRVATQNKILDFCAVNMLLKIMRFGGWRAPFSCNFASSIHATLGQSLPFSKPHILWSVISILTVRRWHEGKHGSYKVTHCNTHICTPAAVRLHFSCAVCIFVKERAGLRRGPGKGGFSGLNVCIFTNSPATQISSSCTWKGFHYLHHNLRLF